MEYFESVFTYTVLYIFNVFLDVKWGYLQLMPF